MDYTYTSNRGISGFPQQYLQGYQQQPAAQPSSSWNSPGVNAQQQWAQYAQAQQQPQQSSNPLLSLLGAFPTSIYDFGGGGSSAAPGARMGIPMGRTLRGGGSRPQVVGGGGARYGGGGGYSPTPTPSAPTSGIPPATTQPMTPVGAGGDLASLLGTYTNPITAGQLSNDAINKAMSTVSAGAPAWAVQKFGGNFGDNMTQNNQRAAINLSRAASEQQASMDLAQQRAKAGAGLDMAGLLQQLNGQNVTSQLNNQDAMLRAVLNLFGGLL